MSVLIADGGMSPTLAGRHILETALCISVGSIWWLCVWSGCCTCQGNLCPSLR